MVLENKPFLNGGEVKKIIKVMLFLKMLLHTQRVIEYKLRKYVERNVNGKTQFFHIENWKMAEYTSDAI
jgi:hypothetical protein